jgi:hypothetical protein
MVTVTRLLSVSETGETEDALIEGTGGNPGWATECETALGKRPTHAPPTSSKHLLSQEGEEINAQFPKSTTEENWPNAQKETQIKWLNRRINSTHGL